MVEHAPGSPARFRFDTADPVLAGAAWSRLAEPGDVVAGALVAALGAGEALAWVAGAAARPGEASAELARLEPGARVARTLAGEMVTGETVTVHDRHAGGSPGAGRSAAPGTGTHSPARALMAGVRRWASRLEGLAPRQDLEALERLDGTLLLPGDAGWPGGLDALGPAAPHALWVRGRGDLAGLSRRAVALVGSRASTSYGERVARDLASGLAARGFTVVSGGAHGIDAEAHRAALAVDGSTLVLLASGVDRLYPSGNRRLMETAMSGGAVVAEVPPGSTPFRQRFLARNRIIAALGSATVVVEAAMRSGALSTANHATRLLRPVGAVPGPVTSMASAGCHELLRSGAAVCVTDAAEAAELAGGATDAAPARHGEHRPGDGLDPSAKAVLDALPVRRGAPVESVARVAGLAVDETRAKLGRLLLAGLAEKEGGAWRRGSR
ncbi:DNA-processing protein DprA [Myceligenerans pegani]|uniref:DNA-protecting protein DprA n=1 Tax=Myceligenerans pegani TaxID=2776917 RepID=A0ABR9MUY2_9MICO|nr:DNA-processing protein DprA [Myceligenerans sp. TRM 65318]MBE1874582.1 DNA-protecting protein DprA [Myceligenerans sp. TRM 65318]MBE3016853.1 DNA-protecting protein DprA [Myceligenerans sp. TRM 65318]